MKKLSNLLRTSSIVGNKKISYFVVRKNIKHARIEFKNNRLYVIAPKNLKNYTNIVKRKEKWILNKQELIQRFLEESKHLIDKFIFLGIPIELENLNTSFSLEIKNKAEIKNILKQILVQKIENAIEKYLKKLGVTYNKILIRSQTTKWASCSSKGNLSFNIKMVSLPETLINYLVYHELVHLIEKGHNDNFISILKEEFPNYKELEEELTRYWFILNQNYWWDKIF